MEDRTRRGRRRLPESARDPDRSVETPAPYCSYREAEGNPHGSLALRSGRGSARQPREHGDVRRIRMAMMSQRPPIGAAIGAIALVAVCATACQGDYRFDTIAQYETPGGCRVSVHASGLVEAGD